MSISLTFRSPAASSSAAALSGRMLGKKRWRHWSVAGAGILLAVAVGFSQPGMQWRPSALELMIPQLLQSPAFAGRGVHAGQQQPHAKHQKEHHKDKKKSGGDKERQDKKQSAPAPESPFEPSVPSGPPPDAIVPDDVTPFLIVLLVNATIFLFTLVATYSVTPGRWHAMSVVTSALYLGGLFAVLNEWDAASTAELLGRAVTAAVIRPIAALLPVALALLHRLHSLLVRSLYLQGAVIASVLLYSWSRGRRAARETQQLLHDARTLAADSAAQATDLGVRLDRSSGSPAALRKLASAELEALEASAQKSLVRIREVLEERRKRERDAIREEMETRLRCVVCCDRHKDMTFQCGHRTCVQCAEKLDNCPQCRAPITLRIRSYD